MAVNSKGILAILPVVLLVVVAFIVDLLRQDGLSKQVNEGITVVLLLATALANAVYNHWLTHKIELDFIVVAIYMASIIQLPQLSALQGCLQSNWLTIINAAADLPVPPEPPVSIKVLVVKPVQTQDAPQPKTMHGKGLSNRYVSQHLLNQYQSPPLLRST